MPVALGVLAVIVVAGLYLWLCALALAFVTVPASLIGGAGGVAAGAVTALVVAGTVFLGGRTGGVLTPADVVAGRLRILRTPPAVRPDFAWPGYFVAQVWRDWWVIAVRVAALLGRIWRWPAGAVYRAGWFGLLGWPLLIPVVVALAGVTAGAAAAVVLVGLVAAGTTAAAWALGTALAVLLRWLDAAGRTVRRSAGNCPQCYEVSPLPVYRCPGSHPDPASALHRDVRPGLLGIAARRCGCGRRLPTTVLRAARAMAALCPLCGADLHSGAGASTDVRVPVFGAPSSGKTHLVMAGVIALLRERGDVEVTLADEHSRRTYTTFESVIGSGGSAIKTDAALPPIAVTLRFRQGRRDALLHVYDAAGEALADPEQNARFQYLDAARTLVFVLDPFAIAEVRHRYRRTFGDLFRAANVSADEPEPSYQGVVNRLRQYGVPTARKRLAFVLSKRDLVEQLPGMTDLIDDHDAIRRWLVGHGADNLVAAAERDFGAVRYFFVSATDRSPGDGPVRPFRWLLADEPVPLPRQRPAGDRTTDEITT